MKSVQREKAKQPESGERKALNKAQDWQSTSEIQEMILPEKPVFVVPLQMLFLYLKFNGWPGQKAPDFLPNLELPRLTWLCSGSQAGFT